VRWLPYSNWEEARRLKARLDRIDRRVSRQVTQLYKEAHREIVDDLRRRLERIADPEGTISLGQLYQLERGSKMEQQIARLLEEAGVQSHRLMAKEIRQELEQVFPTITRSVNQLLPPGIALDLNRVWPEQAAVLVKRAKEMPPFTDVTSQGTAAIMREVSLGAIRGQSVPAIVRRVRGTLSMGKYQAERIVRTEVIRACNEATSWVYRRFGERGLVTGKRRLSALDDRTCLACIALDGTEYPLNAEMDDHVLGRCVFEAIVPTWEELGFEGIEEPARLRRARDPYSGENEIVKFKNSQEWFNSLDSETQARMLGPSRYNLWVEGAVSLDQMVGPGSSLIPLKNLGV